jgi:hypothetical protein
LRTQSTDRANGLRLRRRGRGRSKKEKETLFFYSFFFFFLAGVAGLKRKEKFGFWLSIPKIPKIPQVPSLHGLRERSREKKKVFSA